MLNDASNVARVGLWSPKPLEWVNSSTARNASLLHAFSARWAAAEASRQHERRLVFIRPRFGLGDALNGAIAALWLAELLGATLEVCWPEAVASGWRFAVPQLEASLCKGLTDGVLEILNNRLSRGRYLVDLPDFAYFGCESCANSVVMYRQYLLASTELRRREWVAFSSNRGVTSYAFADDRPAAARPLRNILRRHATPWHAAGAALRTLLALRPRMDGVAGDDEETHCLHYRSHNMKGPLEAFLACIENATSVRVFSDLSGQYMAADADLATRNDDSRRAKLLGADAVRTGHRVRRPVNDFLAWKRLATGCDRFWISRSLFSLTAAAWSLKPHVHIAPRLVRADAESGANCSLFEPVSRVTLPLFIGYP